MMIIFPLRSARHQDELLAYFLFFCLPSLKDLRLPARLFDLEFAILK